ncbi:spore germination protein [Pseudobacillus sp. 179-B 2D1 NHS]|uniref:spore germination protein n=1 Tax=Pseudobacillus sp. 179-B 2D1 NHS TaxID=3374292 RepID=UPI0038791B47
MTEATLVSNSMMITIAAASTSNFAILINGMNVVIQVMKYAQLVIATVAEIGGLALGFVILMMYLTHIKLYGEPH